MGISKLLTQSYNAVRELMVDTTKASHQIIAIGIGTLTIVYLISRLNGNRYRLPPGPMQLPLIGNVIQLACSKYKAQRNFLEMSKRYGPVIRSNVFGVNFIVLNNMDSVREALVTKQDEFANRPSFYSTHTLSEGGQDIAFGQPSPKWKYQRSIVHQAIRKYASGEILENVILGLHEKVSVMIRKKKGSQTIKPLTQFVTYNWILGICFGKAYNADDDTFKNLRNAVQEGLEMMQGGCIVDFYPSLRYCPLVWPQMKAIEQFVGKWMGTISDNVMEHKEAIGAGKTDTVKDITDFIFAQQAEAVDKDSGMKDAINDKFIIHTISDVFGAGIDTINYTLEWLIGYMAMYPNIQDRLHKEIRSIYHPGMSLSKVRNEIPYVDAVLKEVMRKETIIPLGLPLSTGTDTSVGGYEIPKDCMVFINIWAVHNNPEYWEEPDVFNPDRFLEADGSLKKRMPQFIPFSLGRRACIGEVLAKSALFMITTALFERFKFRLPDDIPVNWKLDAQDIPLVNYPKLFNLVIEEYDD